MGLFGRNATTVGLDIGSGLIKLVAISHARSSRSTRGNEVRGTGGCPERGRLGAASRSESG